MPRVAVVGPPAIGAASAGASAIMADPAPEGVEARSRPRAPHRAPPKLMLIEPKGLVAGPCPGLSSVIGELSVLSRGLSCPHCSTPAAYPPGVSSSGALAGSAPARVPSDRDHPRPGGARGRCPGRRPHPLRRNRDFLVVLFGQGISSFGDSISNTAMPILVLALTGSGFAMGIVGVLSTLPDLLVGLPAGAYADRWDRRKMMLGADLGRAVLTALVPISVGIGGPTLAIIIVVAFPINVLRVLWLAAYTAAVPGLVGRGQVPARERHLRGRVQHRLDRGTRAGRAARGCHRTRADDRHRRPHVPRVGRVAAVRPAAAAAGAAGTSRRTSWRTSGRGSRSSPGSPRCAR